MRWLLLALMVAGAPALAVNPDEMLADPALEERARDISRGLRCVQCRNQDIDSSNAAIARDMRLVLRERLAAGDDDDAAVAYLVDRFGAYILLNPPVKPSTYLLWASPVLLLAATLGGFAMFWRRRPDPSLPDLSEEDAALLKRALARDER